MEREIVGLAGDTKKSSGVSNNGKNIGDRAPKKSDTAFKVTMDTDKDNKRESGDGTSEEENVDESTVALVTGISTTPDLSDDNWTGYKPMPKRKKIEKSKKRFSAISLSSESDQSKMVEQVKERRPKSDDSDDSVMVVHNDVEDIVKPNDNGSSGIPEELQVADADKYLATAVKAGSKKNKNGRNVEEKISEQRRTRASVKTVDVSPKDKIDENSKVAVTSTPKHNAKSSKQPSSNSSDGYATDSEDDHVKLTKKRPTNEMAPIDESKAKPPTTAVDNKQMESKRRPRSKGKMVYDWASQGDKENETDDYDKLTNKRPTQEKIPIEVKPSKAAVDKMKAEPKNAQAKELSVIAPKRQASDSESEEVYESQVDKTNEMTARPDDQPPPNKKVAEETKKVIKVAKRTGPRQLSVEPETEPDDKKKKKSKGIEKQKETASNIDEEQRTEQVVSSKKDGTSKDGNGSSKRSAARLLAFENEADDMEDTTDDSGQEKMENAKPVVEITGEPKEKKAKINVNMNVALLELNAPNIPTSRPILSSPNINIEGQSENKPAMGISKETNVSKQNKTTTIAVTPEALLDEQPKITNRSIRIQLRAKSTVERITEAPVTPKTQSIVSPSSSDVDEDPSKNGKPETDIPKDASVSKKNKKTTFADTVNVLSDDEQSSNRSSRLQRRVKSTMENAKNQSPPEKIQPETGTSAPGPKNTPQSRPPILNESGAQSTGRSTRMQRRVQSSMEQALTPLRKTRSSLKVETPTPLAHSTSKPKKSRKTFNIDKLLEHKKNKDGLDVFLVHWEGFDPAYDSWEPAGNLPSGVIVEYFEGKITELNDVVEKLTAALP